jgi:hypothetical protein
VAGTYSLWGIYCSQQVSGHFLKIGHVIPILWITKEIMSRGPKVADMECRETT